MVYLHEVLVIRGFCLAISVCKFEFDLGLVILTEVSVAGHVVCLN